MILMHRGAGKSQNWGQSSTSTPPSHTHTHLALSLVIGAPFTNGS